jgi:hypothetical protein
MIMPTKKILPILGKPCLSRLWIAGGGPAFFAEAADITGLMR